MRRLLVCGLVVVTLTACAGGSKSDARVRVTTTTESAETRTWVAAAEHGVLSDPQRPRSFTASDAACLSHALVDTITVARLKAAGATLSDLSDPNKNLPPKLASLLPSSNQLALAAEIQACSGFSKVFGDAFAQQFVQQVNKNYRPRPQQKECIATWFRSPPSRAMVARIVLSVKTTKKDDQDVAGLFMDCIGLAPLIEPSMHITLSNAEMTCINMLGRRTPAVRTALAQAIQTDTPLSGTSLMTVGVGLVSCLTPAHLIQIGTQHK